MVGNNRITPDWFPHRIRALSICDDARTRDTYIGHRAGIRTRHEQRPAGNSDRGSDWGQDLVCASPPYDP